MSERLFLALPVYTSFKTDFDAFFQKHCRMQEGYKWTPCNSLHITLHFFGETEPEQKKRILEVLPEVFKKQPPVPVRLEGLDAFPEKEEPRIIFADVHSDSFPLLMPLQSRVVEALAQAGFQTGERLYRPHVTLCRIKRVHEDDWKRESWTFERTALAVIGRVVLYRSLLKPEGAVHLEDTVWMLEGGGQ